MEVDQYLLRNHLSDIMTMLKSLQTPLPMVENYLCIDFKKAVLIQDSDDAEIAHLRSSISFRFCPTDPDYVPGQWDFHFRVFLKNLTVVCAKFKNELGIAYWEKLLAHAISMLQQPAKYGPLVQLTVDTVVNDVGKVDKIFLSNFFIMLFDHWPSSATISYQLLNGLNGMLNSNQPEIDWNIHLVEHFASTAFIDDSLICLDFEIIHSVFTALTQGVRERCYCQRPKQPLGTLIRIFYFTRGFCLPQLHKLLSDDLMCSTCTFRLGCCASLNFFSQNKGSKLADLPRMRHSFATLLFSIMFRDPKLKDSELKTVRLVREWWKQFMMNSPELNGVFNPPPPLFPRGCVERDINNKCDLSQYHNSTRRNKADDRVGPPTETKTEDRGLSIVISAVHNSPENVTISNLCKDFESSCENRFPVAEESSQEPTATTGLELVPYQESDLQRIDLKRRYSQRLRNKTAQKRRNDKVNFSKEPKRKKSVKRLGFRENQLVSYRAPVLWDPFMLQPENRLSLAKKLDLVDERMS